MKNFSRFVSSVAAVGLSMNGSIAMAQEVETTDIPQVNPVVEAANQRKAESEAEQAAYNAAKAAAEARSAQIAAEKDALAARFPDSDTTGAAGTATAEGGGYYGTFLAHKAIQNAAESIASDISKVPAIENYEIFLVSGIDVPAASARWRQINSQLTTLQNAVDALLRSLPEGQDKLDLEVQPEGIAVLSLLSAAPQILGGVADIAAFFRSNVTSKGLEVTLEDRELAALVIDRLPANVQVSDPAYSLVTDTGLTEKLTALIASDATLRAKKEEIVVAGQRSLLALKQDREPIVARIAEIDEQLKTETDEAKKLRLQQERSSRNTQRLTLDEHISFLEKLTTNRGAAIDTLRADVDAVIKALNTPNDAGITPLQATDAVAIMVAAKNAALLRLHVNSEGGERQIKTGAFGSGRVSYLGGAGVSFMLSDRNGRVLATSSQSVVRQESMKRGDFFKRNMTEGTDNE